MNRIFPLFPHDPLIDADCRGPELFDEFEVVCREMPLYEVVISAGNPDIQRYLVCMRHRKRAKEEKGVF